LEAAQFQFSNICTCPSKSISLCCKKMMIDLFYF
jgi:hypothetical protein